ncbi:MAG: ACP S-malonyltransferase [Gammaproteobacteria bacterium]|nr:ACP S-malonyltransferase [Gammaproteobacteria bacterium]
MHSMAVIFPGQGSQQVGMLSTFASRYPLVQATFDRASAVLDFDLWALVQNGPDALLNKTIHTQPALLAASYALWQILKQETDLSPQAFAGHSLGEYTALVCSNALGFEDAIQLVRLRGELMQDAVPEGEGGMAALLGLEEALVEEICAASRGFNEVLMPANFNSLGQIVIAGHLVAVERAILLAREKGAKLAVKLPVSVPSHSTLMEPAASQLSKALNSIVLNKPEIPILSNFDAKPYSDVDSIREGLVKQLCSPVQWVKTIQAFSKLGVLSVIECGPGKVLTGLNKRINKDLELMSTAEIGQFDAVLKRMHEG